MNGWPPDTVLIGVIDDGVAFGHERLRLANGRSRVEAYWNMNGLFPVRPPVPPFVSPLFGELTRIDIDNLLGAAVVGGVVDESLLYGLAGVINHTDPRHKTVAWRRAHGAHVLDLAAGEDPVLNVGNRPVIAVELPTPVVARTNGDLLDAYVISGIRYILDRAWRLSPLRPLPLVINISFGYTAGPHDGSGVLERFMDLVVQLRPNTEIVLPAGNAHLSRCHADIDFAAENPVLLDWIVQPNDRTDSAIEVWLPGVPVPGANRLTMTVTPPGAAPLAISEITPPIVDVFDAAGTAMGRMVRATPGGRRIFRLTIQPTDRAQPDPRRRAPAGRWQLRFDPGPAAMGVAEAWVQRDDSLYGYPQSGRQAYFDRPDYVRFDAGGREICDDNDPAQLATPSRVTRSNLVNAIATGASTIVAGGYLDRSGLIAKYSAGGPNPPPAIGPTKPDALLPSEGSKPHPGVLAAGSRSGGRVPMSGTSVAAPQLARLVANLMANAAPANRAAIRLAAANAEAAHPPPPWPPLPADRGGAGRLPGVPPPVPRYLPGD